MSPAAASLWERAGRLIDGLTALLLLAMVLLNCANAAGRYLFGRGVQGADELLVFSMVWLVALALTRVTAGERHLRFDLLGRSLPPRGLALREAAIHLLVAATCGYVALQSLAFLERVMLVNQRSMDLGMPMAVPHAALLAGLGLTAVISFAQAARRLQSAFAVGRER